MPPRRRFVTRRGAVDAWGCRGDLDQGDARRVAVFPVVRPPVKPWRFGANDLVQSAMRSGRLRSGIIVGARLLRTDSPPRTSEVGAMNVVMRPNAIATTMTTNRVLLDWVAESANLCRPDQVYWCNGSAEEKRRLLERAVLEGVLIPLDQRKRPGCYLHRSDPRDVARVEHLTYLCLPTKAETGPT